MRFDWTRVLSSDGVRAALIFILKSVLPALLAIGVVTWSLETVGLVLIAVEAVVTGIFLIMRVGFGLETRD